MIEIRRRIPTPFSGASGIPATAAEPEVGATSVPSVRTVVVLPAPFGPRKPKTSMEWTSRARNRRAESYETFCIGVFSVRDGKIQAVREYMDTLYAHRTAFSR
jgi:hypothetical protein